MLEEYLQFAKDLAYEAGGVMRHYFQGEFISKKKEDGSNVTEADEKINQLVLDQVAKKYPDHAVLGEEGSIGDVEGAEFTWVCDPIDGTNAFMMGIPTNMFSLALTQHGEPIVAVIYDPYLDRLFTATTDQKTMVNDDPIKVSDRDSMKGAIFGLGTPKMLDVSHPEFSKAFYNQKARMIMPWSVCYEGVLTAGGQLEFHIFPIANAHDVAAIKLLVEQAGGKTSDLEGNDQKYDRTTNGFVASNGILHDEVIDLIKPFL